MAISRIREQFLLNNLINYVCELKEREDIDEKRMFWENIIGMNEKELKEYEVLV